MKTFIEGQNTNTTVNVDCEPLNGQLAWYRGMSKRVNMQFMCDIPCFINAVQNDWKNSPNILL